MSSNLAPGDFANPNGVVGAYSASEAATYTRPNFEDVPNRFSNDVVYGGSNTNVGTASNVQAANGNYVPLAGGRKLFARNINMNGGTNLGMDLNDPSASVGTVGTGHPGHVAVDLSADRPNQPVNKLTPFPLGGGRCRGRRNKNKRSRKIKKTNRHYRKTCGRKSHKKRHTRKRRKMRGGRGSKNNKLSRRFPGDSKKRGGKGWGGINLQDFSSGLSLDSKKMKGGSPQPFSNQPMSFGYTFDNANINADSSALASPMPIKSYFSCDNVARN
jgi:hypothetical protein